MSYQLSVVIPCLNEATTLARVIAEAFDGLGKSGIEGEVVIADNGSVDGSLDIAQQHGARVVHVTSRGYGSALHHGILSARAPWVIFGDADLSYDFTQINRFAPFMEQDVDLVIGTRLGGTIERGAMPLLNRYLGTPVLNFAIRLFFGLATSDCNSGMRLLRRSFYAHVPMRAPGMEWASELLVKTSLCNGRCAEVPIDFRRDQRGRPPHLRRWYDGWRHLKSIVLLSPNRLIALPSSLSFLIACLISAAGNFPLALFFAEVATAGIVLCLHVKLLMHVDNVRTSRLISRLIGTATAEYMLAAGVASLLLGLIPWLWIGRAGLDGVVCTLFYLTLTGALLVLSSFFWGSFITHCVQRLPEAADVMEIDSYGQSRNRQVIAPSASQPNERPKVPSQLRDNEQAETRPRTIAIPSERVRRTAPLAHERTPPTGG